MQEVATKKMPAVVATSSLTSLAVAGAMFVAPTMTGTVGQDAYLDNPAPMIRYINDAFDFSTSTGKMVAYENMENPVAGAKFAAYEMFGEMRSSTQEEKQLYEDMLERMSTPIDVDIFAL